MVITLRVMGSSHHAERDGYGLRMLYSMCPANPDITMPRELILNKLDPDLACAIALGLVEHNFIVATLESITIHDEDFQVLGQQPDWLTEDDPLDIATRDYLVARHLALLAGHHGEADHAWAAAQAIGTREEANRRAIEARATGRALLEERRVLESARAAGMTVFGG